MVFVEFISSNYPHVEAKHYFVGASLEDVLADTKNGKEFGFAIFSSYKEISEEEAHNLNLELLEEGISCVQKGTESFKLVTPHK